ncbi:potassium channel family protein [Virgibacillus sp. LDC-1]|uniref:potassium channel family protein n=1 Tax=Virgibacillus sp. LDC-1 TaxID=3039856 RepID=UPI0024DEB407|nr:potassium channel family protein [Virgibacillus sp. LDC-1]
MHAERIKQAYYQLPILIRLLLTTIIVMVLFGITIHLVEPNEFPSFFDGIWWAFVTAATVGYGDYAPLSTAGRMIGILLMLTGAGLLTFYISQFASSTVKYEQNRSKGKLAFKGKDHLIFIGWNERTKQMIDMALHVDPHFRIVLIDRTLNHLAYQAYPVHFIHGDAAEDHTLMKANVAEASKVIITANVAAGERQADNYTILTTVAIRGNNAHIPIIAEILTKKQFSNAVRAGTTTIIRPNDFLGTLLFHALFRDHAGKPFDTLLQLLLTQNICIVRLPKQLVHKSVLDAQQLLMKDNKIVVGIRREKEMKLNPPADLLLKQTDNLILLEPWKRNK